MEEIAVAILHLAGITATQEASQQVQLPCQCASQSRIQQALLQHEEQYTAEITYGIIVAIPHLAGLTATLGSQNRIISNYEI